MSRSTFTLIIVVGLLAALSSWLSHEKKSDPITLAQALPHIPDYYITAFSAASYSPQGEPRHSLSAERMTHYADDRTSELLKPQLQFVTPTGEQWQLQAGTGHLDGSGDKLQLSNSVLIRRHGAGGEMELKTAALQVLTHKEFATTRTPTTITAPNLQIEASGLDAHIAEERLVLYSVRGRYEP